MKKLLINIVLLAIVIFLGYKVFDSIMQPVEFNNEKEKREVEVVQRLKDIRSAQIFYKQAYNKYMGNFDTLVDFLKTYEIPVVKLIPDPEDTTFTKTISDTLGYVKVMDSLFGKRKSFDVNKLSIVPFSDNVSFDLKAGVIPRGGVTVSVFEASALFKTYLIGLDEQRVNNLVAYEEQIDKFPGLRVGSMEEPSTDGNWE